MPSRTLHDRTKDSPDSLELVGIISLTAEEIDIGACTMRSTQRSTSMRSDMIKEWVELPENLKEHWRKAFRQALQSVGFL